MATQTKQEKMVVRIGKVLRQAEEAPEGSPEREAFMEAAMRLSQAHSIDLAVARAKAYSKDKAEEPEERKYVVGKIGTGRTPTKTNAHFVDLVLALGQAYDMKPLIATSNVFVWLMGYPSDHEMVEKMYSILSVQMVAEADAALARGENKVTVREVKRRREEIPEDQRMWGAPDGDYWTEKRFAYDESEVGEADWYSGINGQDITYTLKAPPSHRLVDVLDDNGNLVYEEKEVSSVDGRVWRTNFYKGFVSKVASRMRTARKAAMKEAGIDVADQKSSETGLVLLNKKEEIADRYETQMLVRASKRGGYTGAEVSRTSHAAHAAGQAAATRATYGDERVVDH